jgi:PHP family Zn ribbon phosphoesterase
METGEEELNMVQLQGSRDKKTGYKMATGFMCVDFFGDQVQIDEEMNIIYEEPRLLTSGLDVSIEKIEQEVHRLQGMFIPAHIDKQKTSVISQLGFIPFDLDYEAVEISQNTTKEAMILQHKYLKSKPFIRSSDSHYPNQIGMNTTFLEMPTRNFEEIKKAILQNRISFSE